MGSSKSDVSKLLKLMNDSVLNKSSLEDFVAEVLESFDLKLKDVVDNGKPKIVSKPLKSAEVYTEKDHFGQSDLGHYDSILKELRARHSDHLADLEAGKNKELFLPFKDPDQKILDKMHKIMKKPTTIQELNEKDIKEAQEEVKRKQLKAKENFDKGKGAFMKKRKWSEMWNMPENDFLKFLQEKSSLLSAKEQDLLNSKENAELKQEFIRLLKVRDAFEKTTPITESDESGEKFPDIDFAEILTDRDYAVVENGIPTEQPPHHLDNSALSRGPREPRYAVRVLDAPLLKEVHKPDGSITHFVSEVPKHISDLEEKATTIREWYGNKENEPSLSDLGDQFKQLVNSAKLQHTPSEADINNAASIAKDVIKTIKSVKPKSNSKAKKKTPTSKRKSK